MTGLHSITSANIQIESIQSCMVGRWIALDNLSQIHFERNRASAIICSVDQKPLFRLFLARPSEPGAGGNAPPPPTTPGFGRLLTRGADYARHIATCPPPYFQTFQGPCSQDHFSPLHHNLNQSPLCYCAISNRLLASR